MRRSESEAHPEEGDRRPQAQDQEAWYCKLWRELSPSIPKFLRFAISVAFALCLALTPAHAAEPPDNVAEAIAQAAQACKDMDGTPNTDAVLRVEDLNGDGGEDWLADYAKLKCEGGVHPLCGSGGCTIQIYFWDGGTSWDVVFEDLVQSYKFGKSGGKRMLYVTTSGLPCNKPVSETCKYTYRLEKDAVVPVK
ncbi:MAG: hypothetical protein H7X74_02590 [Methyloceanibacter sp.]|nr:hypothetical protein [Methyloceanibacter sp.]